MLFILVCSVRLSHVCSCIWRQSSGVPFGMFRHWHAIAGIADIYSSLENKAKVHTNNAMTNVNANASNDVHTRKMQVQENDFIVITNTIIVIIIIIVIVTIIIIIVLIRKKILVLLEK